jgi:hypothetical protein
MTDAYTLSVLSIVLLIQIVTVPVKWLFGMKTEEIDFVWIAITMLAIAVVVK